MLSISGRRDHEREMLERCKKGAKNLVMQAASKSREGKNMVPLLDPPGKIQPC